MKRFYQPDHRQITKFDSYTEDFSLTFQKVVFYEPVGFQGYSQALNQKEESVMTKAELVEKMAKDAGISKGAANKALDSFVDAVTAE